MRQRYVARAEAGKGWRIFNRKTAKPWGNYFRLYPEVLLEELNNQRRPQVIVELTKTYQKQ